MRWPHQGRADLHVHTAASDGLPSIGEVLDYAENSARLEVVAITDHDDLSPSLRARDLAEKWGFRCAVVPGMEVTTLNGHVLGLFLEEPVPSMRSLRHTVEAIHEKGGLCVIPHPFSWLVYSVGRSRLEGLLGDGMEERLPDALEMANPTPAGRVTRRHVRRLNKEVYSLATVGGSDAHFAQAVGSALTLFPGRTPADLRSAILDKTTQVAELPQRHMPRFKPAEVAAQTFRALVIHPRKLVWRVALQALGET